MSRCIAGSFLFNPKSNNMVKVVYTDTTTHLKHAPVYYPNMEETIETFDRCFENVVEVNPLEYTMDQVVEGKTTHYRANLTIVDNDTLKPVKDE